MLFEEMMKNEYKSGHEDGMKEGRQLGQINLAFQVINAHFPISDNLTERIKSVDDEQVLLQLIDAASAAAGQEEFELLAEKLLAHQVEST
ncbi:MAG: hypothetical protein MJ131_08430 [Lachnospiraceae bacterium]|nr:hypothetical protein [Lachnospiraceae bacterium]